jgi:hypothetical protein
MAGAIMTAGTGPRLGQNHSQTCSGRRSYRDLPHPKGKSKSINTRDETDVTAKYFAYKLRAGSPQHKCLCEGDVIVGATVTSPCPKLTPAATRSRLRTLRASACFRRRRIGRTRKGALHLDRSCAWQECPRRAFTPSLRLSHNPRIRRHVEAAQNATLAEFAWRQPNRT